MEHVMAVANKLIDLGLRHDRLLTQMKLQKLLFFMQGWHLGLTGEPLFENDFEAWDYGPVVPAVYQELREFGIKGINRLGRALIPCGDQFVIAEPKLENPERLDPLFERIWQVYGRYSGNQLSDMTHKPDTPWTKVREPYGNKVPRSLRIPKELMREYFAAQRRPAHA